MPDADGAQALPCGPLGDVLDPVWKTTGQRSGFASRLVVDLSSARLQLLAEQGGTPGRGERIEDLPIEIVEFGRRPQILREAGQADRAREDEAEAIGPTLAEVSEVGQSEPSGAFTFALIELIKPPRNLVEHDEQPILRPETAEDVSGGGGQPGPPVNGW